MKKNLLKFSLVVLLIALYGSALFYLHQNYNEKRWIPRIVLNLPNLLNQDISEQSNAKELNVLPVVESSSETMGFQVMFDNTPLPETDLVQPWEDEKDAARIYARPTENEDDKPRLSIILTEVGLDEKLFTESVLRLPPVITLSFSPYTMRLSEKIKYARQRGFENMFDIVIEGKGGFDNGGAQALKSGQTLFDVQNMFQRTYFDLQVPFVGFLVGGQMPLDADVWEQIQQEQIEQFGLLLVPFDSAKRVDSDKLYSVAIELALEQAKEKAIEQGQYILALPMHPAVVHTLVNWVGTQSHPDISFVPVSSIVKTNQ